MTNRIHIDTIAQDNYIFAARTYLISKKGLLVDEAARIIEPLEWYMKTGRASAAWLKACMVKKPYLIARIMLAHTNASYDDSINAITAYINPV